jgi:hypothetical protein
LQARQRAIAAELLVVAPATTFVLATEPLLICPRLSAGKPTNQAAPWATVFPHPYSLD